MNERKERRIHERFQASDRAVAVLSSRSIRSDQIKCMSMGEIALEVYKSKPTQMGQIIDISRGGLAFRYIDEKEISSELYEIAIIFAVDFFCMDNVLAETISDFEIESENPFASFTIRRCSFQFKKLTLKQNSMLDYFIQKHTMDESEQIPLV